MKKLFILIAIGLLTIVLLNQNVQAQTNKSYPKGRVNFTSFVQSKQVTNELPLIYRENYRYHFETKGYLMKYSSPAVRQNCEVTAYIKPGPHHYASETSKDYRDFISRKFSWDLIFK